MAGAAALIAVGLSLRLQRLCRLVQLRTFPQTDPCLHHPPRRPPADKQTFPREDVVGWYATGGEITDADMVIQRKVGAGWLPAFICMPAARHRLEPMAAVALRSARCLPAAL